jgi:hypothetical protein
LTAYLQHGLAGLENRKKAPKRPANRTAPEIVEKVLHLRTTYRLGPHTHRLVPGALSRHHHLQCRRVSHSQAQRHQCLPSGTRVRKIHTQRYQKQVPRHQIQADVKFLKFEGKDGKSVKRYQYTAIDDATRIRALKIYDPHNQSKAIDFINTIIDKFPFRIREVRTDNGHEFQAQFHWHVEDLGIRYAYIKLASPQLNGKVERSHPTDEQEFNQLPTYTDDVDLRAGSPNGSSSTTSPDLTVHSTERHLTRSSVSDYNRTPDVS